MRDKRFDKIEMNDKTGWVKIYRSISNEPWYSKPLICHLAIHLILNALVNGKKIVYQKREKSIKRGQCITSLRKLKNETGLTFQQTRTALEVLSNSHFLEYKTTHHFTMITICNYDKYQSKQNTSNTQHSNNTGKALSQNSIEATKQKSNTAITHKKHTQQLKPLSIKAVQTPKNERMKEIKEKEINKEKEKILSDENGNAKLIAWIKEETEKGLISVTESKQAFNEIQQGIFTEENMNKLVSNWSCRKEIKKGETNIYYH